MTARATEHSAALAQSITWAGSKQAYYTARLMVDRDLVDDFYRAYAYFRWLDDVVDISSGSDEERLSFMAQQTELIDLLYKGERPVKLAPEEEIVADLVANDRGENSGLQSFIRNMLAIIDFDAQRKGRLIDRQELDWYSERLSTSVTDGIQYFIGNGHSYPETGGRLLAAYAAHVVHLLRDMLPDTADGFINIPREYLDAHGIGPNDFDSAPFRAWVRERAEQARRCFQEGKQYLDGLEVLRCKVVGRWYCARFEGVLDTIERDGFLLRADYSERRSFSTWLEIGWLGLSVPIRHLARGRA